MGLNLAYIPGARDIAALAGVKCLKEVKDSILKNRIFDILVKYRWPLFFQALIIAATTTAYWPGLHGDFEFDDGVNLLQNNALHLEHLTLNSIWSAALSGDAGPFSLSFQALSLYAPNLVIKWVQPKVFI